jgi:tripartite-type tricarboxylate transporter receptor subunit TctC
MAEENMRRFLKGTALAALVLLPPAAPAADSPDNYPSRPITVIVPFTPGASTDAVARLSRDPMSEALGQPIIIDNRPGAAGTTGSAAVVNAKPDGYTLLVSVNAPLTMNMYLQKSFPFEPRAALAPVTLAAESILVLAVNASLPVKTVTELVDYAKKHPGTLSYGSAGVGSAHHIAGELLKQRTGIDMVHVPYRGSAPAMQDLVAGAIKVSFGTTPAVLPQAATGAIRIIALAEERRSPELPAFRPSPRPCQASSQIPGSACSRRPAPRRPSSRSSTGR